MDNKDRAREVLAERLRVLIMDLNKIGWRSDMALIRETMEALTQERTDALREAAEIAQGKANRIMDLMKADGQITEARVSAQVACEEVAQEISSLIPKEQKDAG